MMPPGCCPVVFFTFVKPFLQGAQGIHCEPEYFLTLHISLHTQMQSYLQWYQSYRPLNTLSRPNSSSVYL